MPVLKFLCMVMSLLLITSWASAAETVARIRSKLVNAPEKDSQSAGPLCGVYAACDALRLIGISVNENEFLASRYVSSCEGSSAEDICAMVRDAGGRASQLGRLSAYDIRTFNGPIVANVRRNPSDDRFRHWVVVLARDGDVAVYDGLSPPRQMPMGHFLSVWSGIGVLVSNSQTPPSWPLWLGRAAVLLTIMNVTTPLMYFKADMKRRLEGLKVYQQMVVIFGMAVIGSLAGNAILGDLVNYQESVKIASAHTARGYSVGSLDDVILASSNQNELLVDARRHQDFLLGSVPSAVNIAVDSSEWKMRDQLKGLDKNAKIVVFCQSEACAYDESVAKQLVGIGFQNVTVSDQGWREYQQRAAAGEPLTGEAGGHQ